MPSSPPPPILDRSRPLRAWQLLAAAVLVALAAPLAASAQAPAEPGTSEQATAVFGDQVDVTLVTTSFYVTDEDGKPVRDLRADEVEVRLGDQTLPLAHFEAITGGAVAETPQPAAPGAAAAPVAIPTAPTPRHVFLFFDLAFSLPRGVAAARTAAAKVVGDLPASDLLYLVTYSTDNSLEQEMGPVRTPEQRAALLAAIAAIEPDDKRLRRRPDLQPIARGKRESFRVDAGYLEVQASDMVNYELQGADLAKHLESFATFLRQLPGPKVLVYFSQGIDSDTYGGAAAGVRALRGAPHLGVNRHPGLHNRFEPALQALAQSGALVFYVNPIVGFEPGDRVEIAVDADAAWVNDAPTGDGSLAMMSEVSGGIVMRDPNLESLRERLDSWLDGRYELGVYLAATPEGGALPADIVVTRPGVRAWTAKWLQPPRAVRQLAASERAFLAVQLVVQNDPRLTLRNLAAPALEPLRGVPGSAPEGEKLRLRFTPDEWSQDQLLRGLELYSVVVTPGDPPQLATLEQRLFTPTPNRAPVESLTPAQPQLLWGLVAYDLTSGKIYLGRFPITAAPAAELTAAPTPGR